MTDPIADRNAAYFARVDEMIDRLRELGCVTSRDLATSLGWSIHEVRGKLMAARGRHKVIYRGGTWEVR